MYDENLASKILAHALKEYPSAVIGMSHLQELLGNEREEEILNALDALEQEGRVSFDPPVRTGRDKVLRSFINLRLTASGKIKAEHIPPESSGPVFFDPSKSS